MNADQLNALMKNNPDLQVIGGGVPGLRAVKVEPTAVSTKPIGKLTINKVCFNLHKYHCPNHEGELATSAVTVWTPKDHKASVKFQCGCLIIGDLA